MSQDTYCIKLTGKAELEAPLEIGHNIKTTLEGSITTETIADNEDGTKTHYFTFRPVQVEVITATGERMRAKDTRSRSQQLRALLMKRWREQNVAQEFDKWYDDRMVEIMHTL